MNVDDRLNSDSGTHFFSGMSMLVRLPIEQAKRDRAAGRRPGTLISGYPGSPMGSYDLQLARAHKLLDQEDVRFLPAGNEEQAVTALMGTQMIDGFPHERYDGVNGYWYGKGPGIDRAGDAFKHANFAGTSQNGAVVILSGEDHEAKSSTMPFQQDYAFVSAGIPVLYPSSIAEFRSLGLHATAMSRYSGCWVALKLTSALCDGGEVVAVASDDVQCLVPVPADGEPKYLKKADFSFFPGKNIEQERHLYRDKHAAALRYCRLNGLNRIERKQTSDRVGIISAGKSAADVRQALSDLKLDPAGSGRAGVAVLTLGMTYPLDEDLVREFADGLDEVVVIEEKRSFIEDAVKVALQPLGQAIRVSGKSTPEGEVLFPVEGAMDADLVTRRLGQHLSPHLPSVASAPRLAELADVAARTYTSHVARTPNFCSGCPHSASTVLAEGQIAFGAPGCNCFNTVIDQPERHIDTMTHMGGEGLPWIGLAPFTERSHLVQHVGDGSLYHSSYLNIRWAVATNTHITFKILFNGSLANTGAQPAPGQHGLAALTRGLESEGVQTIVICSKDPEQYRDQRLGQGVTVRSADELTLVSQELESVPGVSVMIYDESCANERRRQIKRGKVAAPTKHLLINEAVCENCGDCGAKSNCMSLQKTPTEFGEKTRIHTSSCNDDYSCLAGECPSFVSIEVKDGTGYRKPVVRPVEASELEDPPGRQAITQPYHIYMPGVGGTGVLSANAILAFAATLDGLGVISFDQTGAAQKWGSVLSSLTVLPPEGASSATSSENSPRPAGGFTNRVGQGLADLYLALDEVGSVAPTNLDRCSPARTVGVVNTDLFPTGEMVRDVHHVVDVDSMRASIERYVAPGALHAVPARSIAEKVFGDYMMTNMVAIGAAYQLGLVPMSSESIQRAIELNGVAVATNIQAFRYGRLWVEDPERIYRLVEPVRTTTGEERAQRARSLSRRRRAAYKQLNARVDAACLPDELRRLLAVRLAELVDYQAGPWAEQYLDEVLHTHAVEESVTSGQTDVTEAVIRNLFKLMAYKDEYEVARLYLKNDWKHAIDNTFEAPVSMTFNLEPPLLRKLGHEGKLSVSSSFAFPAFRVLRSTRQLRGTRFDPFAYQATRREERQLIDWYRDLLQTALASLRPLTAPTVLQIAKLPDGIRGYEGVKSRNVVHAKREAERLCENLRRPPLGLHPVVKAR